MSTHAQQDRRDKIVNPYSDHLGPDAERDFERALAAEPALCAVDCLVTALCELLLSSDEFEHASLWDEGLQPVVAALVGLDRYVAIVDPPDDETERFLCSPDTLATVASTLLARMYDADPLSCGIEVAR